MSKLVFSKKLKAFAIALMVIFIDGCVEPVSPDFQFVEGLVFVEGFASTTVGGSFVTINESAEEFGIKVVRFIPAATVSFENVDSGTSIALMEAGESYLPPPDFMAFPGETWKLKMTLANGKTYESLPEKILEPVEISDLDVRYDPELVFREIYGGKFVPGHAVSVSFEDPPEGENYYYWSYRSFETLNYCKKCVEAIFRDGECTPFDLQGRFRTYFDYICETECWQIRFPESVSIFDDKFSNGKTISNLPVGDLLLYTKENLVVEIQQFSLTPAAYEYYSVLKDIVDDAAGLNAPPPAALIGNLFNPQDPDEFVLGRFTAAASSVASVFIERGDAIFEPPLETQDPILLEPLVGSPYPPPATIFAPCIESKFRTTKKPNAWINL